MLKKKGVDNSKFSKIMGQSSNIKKVVIPSIYVHQYVHAMKRLSCILVGSAWL